MGVGSVDRTCCCRLFQRSRLKFCVLRKVSIRNTQYKPQIGHPMNLAIVQSKTNLSHPAENVARAVAYVEEAARMGADLVLLPETYPGPWTEPVNYDAKSALAEVAASSNIMVAYGHIEPVPEAPSRYFTSHTLLGATGEVIGTYRRTTPAGPWLYKGHWFWDFEWQEANELPIFETPLGKIGIAICSEVYMPELCRALALQGAEIILLPAGVPKGGMHETWRTLIFARAIENLCYTATCQNLFEADDLGLAMICSPERVLVEEGSAGVFVTAVDLDRIRLLRETPDQWDFPGEKQCKPAIFSQWYRPELHGQRLAELAKDAHPRVINV